MRKETIMIEPLQWVIEEVEKLPEDAQKVIAERLLRDIQREPRYSMMPHDEAMHIYCDVKLRYDDVFRELAKL
jgi:hypothetical protein